MHKVIKMVSEYKTCIIVLSILAYIIKPTLASYKLGSFIPILLSSPISVFIVTNTRPTTKIYLRTLVSIESTAYSILYILSFLITGYMYATIKLFSNINISLFLAFIPVSTIYYLFSPLLVWLCKKQWINLPQFNIYIKIVSAVFILATFSILVRAVHFENPIVVEVFAFLSVFMMITTQCVLAELISPDRNVNETVE